MTTDTPRRRWFRFSLRTLFVMVTVLACWLGWERSVSMERQRVREYVTARGGAFGHSDRFRFNVFDDWVEAGIELPASFTEAEIAEVRRAFPESYQIGKRGR